MNESRRRALHLPLPPPSRQSPFPSFTYSNADADSTAEERLQWRNHPQLATPDPDAVVGDPFEKVGVGGAGGESGSVNESGESKGSGASADVDEGAGTGSEVKSEEVDVSGVGGATEGGGGIVEKGCSEKRGGGRDGDTHDGGAELGEKKKLGWRERIRHFTWTWFTMTMATGGIANVLYTVPFRFRGLYAIGCAFFILNIVLFIFNIICISLRFYWYPRTFKSSFLHPTESLFIPACVISFGTILINISQYGVGAEGVGPWLEGTMVVLYWVDCGLAICFSVGIYLIMWSTQHFTISQMTPVWIFPAYPLLIIGPHAANLAPKVADPTRALNIILSGYVIQGIGFMVSLMIYSAYIYRLMTQKLPKESLRPGMFISVGPSGFTIAGIVGMGQEIPKVVHQDFMGEGMGEFAGKVSMICANWMGLWLWGLALWFFFVSVGAHWSCARRGKLDFAMTWYSFIFPNTALTTATFGIAKALNGNEPIKYVGAGMSIGLIVTWVVVFGMMIRAVGMRQILWPQKQEDRTEGGWTLRADEEERRRWHHDGEDGGEAGTRRRRGFSFASLKSHR